MLGSRAVVAKLWPQLRTRKRGIARHSGPQAQNHRAEVVSVCQSTQILNTLRCCVFACISRALICQPLTIPKR